MRIIYQFLFIIILSKSLSTQTHWVSQTIPDEIKSLSPICFTGNDIGFSGGRGQGSFGQVAGVGIYTTNGGVEWNLSIIPDSIRMIVYSRLFNNSVGFAAAAYNYFNSLKGNFNDYIGKLYKETDYIEIPYALLGLFREEKTGGMIIKTTDAGINWNTISVLPDSFVYITGGCFINEETGFIIATTDSSTHILKTTDGGYSWKGKFTFPQSSGSKSIVFSTPSNGVAVGYNLSTIEQGIIAVTNDGGENWTYQFITQAGNLGAVSFSDENTFYAIGQNFQNSYIFKSTNAGIDWLQSSFQSTQFFLDGINFLQNTNSGIVFGTAFSNSSEIFFIKTNDGGNTWSGPEFIQSFPGTAYCSVILDADNIYLSGVKGFGGGLILKTSDAMLPVERYFQASPEEFIVYQNYPNPFNPSTKIIWQSPVGSWQTLKVYDVLGNEVVKLVDKYKPAGKYEVDFNASCLSSGVYYYQLKTENYMETKKMILMR